GRRPGRRATGRRPGDAPGEARRPRPQRSCGRRAAARAHRDRPVPRRLPGLRDGAAGLDRRRRPVRPGAGRAPARGAMTLARKAARLPSIARDGWRYPALRVRARGEQTAVEALVALGFDEAELQTYER